MISKAAFLGLGAFFLYPQRDTRIKLYYNEDNTKNSEIIQQCPTLSKGKFRPTPWIGNNLLQSHYGAGCKSLRFDRKQIQDVTYKREMVNLPDGGCMSIDWYNGKTKEDGKVLIVLHGVTGGSNTSYIKHIVKAADEGGFFVGVLHNRGINDTPLLTPKTSHAGSTDDIQTAMEHIIQAHPKSKLYGVGCSMGGNLLLKLAGETQDACPFKAIATLSTPYDINLCSKRLQKNYPDRYLCDKSLTDNFRQLLEKHKEALKPLEESHGIDIESAMQAKRTKAFDELITRRMFGFRTAEHYYRSASCIHKLREIKIPTLAVSAIDDPMIPQECLPVDEFKINPNTILVLTPAGGHLGWFTGLLPRRWYPKPVIEFLKSVE